MILSHQGKGLSFSALDKALGYRPKQFLWSAEAMSFMLRQRFSGILIDPFDYRRFASEGGSYLKKVWSSSKVRFELSHTSILRLQLAVRHMIGAQSWKQGVATMADIERYFRQGWYVSPVVNGRALQGKPGHSQHVVLITGLTKDHIIFHNPGLPPKDNQRMTIKTFNRAFYGELRVWHLIR